MPVEFNPGKENGGDNGSELLAALDLGSNSFHLIVVRVSEGEVRPVERLAERVQLGAGMRKGMLDPNAIARGLACLARFRQALDTLKPRLVRVVATNSLRAAKNTREFAAPAESVIGFPVQVISGREEARLVYLGVAHTLSDDDRARLVVDIGGGSTEFIIGERFEARLTESLYMGCVSYRDRFFPGETFGEAEFDAAYWAAFAEVSVIRRNYLRQGWNNAVGSSGTLRTIAEVIAANGWGEPVITPQGLAKLRKKLLSIGNTADLSRLSGLAEKRREIFVSGVAITKAIFDCLKIDQMQVSSGALREGVIYDMIGRLRHEDVRERSIAAMMQRYSVDEPAAGQVEEIALRLFNQVNGIWGLTPEDRELLSRAARIQSIGLAISHSQFHKHGQYLVQNSDLPGFTRVEQQELALLVRSHRRKLPVAELKSWEKAQQARLLRLCVLLRLAVLFKYIGQAEELADVSLQAGDSSLELELPTGWLHRHPLTRAALKAEREYLSAAGFELLPDIS